MSSAYSHDSISTLKHLATSSDPRTSIKALRSLCEIFASFPNTYPHLFEAIKFRLTKMSDTFSVQTTCIDVLVTVVKQPSTSSPWMNERYLATKELWPVVSRWIQRFFETIIDAEDPATDDTIRSVKTTLQHVVELLLALTDPVAFDNPRLPNSQGYFRRCISSHAFFECTIRLWVHTAAILEYRDAFSIFTPVALSLKDYYLSQGSEGYCIMAQVLDALPRAVMESCLQSTIISFADDPLRSTDQCVMSFIFLDCASILSPAFRHTLLAARSLYWAMGIIKTTLRRCTLQTSENKGLAEVILTLLIVCLDYIGNVLQVEGRRWVGDVLKMRIIDCLWEIDTLFHTLDLYVQGASSVTDLLKLIAVYAVNATVFFPIQVSIRRAIPEGWRSSVPYIAEGWDLLHTEMENMGPCMNAMNKDLFRDCSLSSCAKRGARRACTGCRQALYCSQECQKTDWQNHRTTCSTYAEKFARAEPTKPVAHTWELFIIEQVLLYALKQSSRKDWYAQLQQDFVDRHPECTLGDLGYFIDLARVPRNVSVLRVDRLGDEKYLRSSREGTVVIQWRLPWAGLEPKDCLVCVSSLQIPNRNMPKN